MLVEDALAETTLSPYAKVRLLDYASTALLNNANGEQLRTCNAIDVHRIFEMYDRFGFSTGEGQHFRQIPTYGLGVYSLVQAHYVRQISADGADRPSVRRRWVQVVIDHMHSEQDALPSAEHEDFVIDGLYSLCRPAYSAALDDDWEHVAEITSFVEENTERLGCRITPNLQWTNLLETNRLLRFGKMDQARARHSALLDRRKKFGFLTPGNHALAKAVEETSYYVSNEYTPFAHAVDVPAVGLRRGNLDALSLSRE